MCACKAVLFGIVLWSLNVQLWLIFTVALFVLGFIPSIGGTIGTLLPVPFIILDPNQSLLTVFLVVGLSLVIHVNELSFVFIHFLFIASFISFHLILF